MNFNNSSESDADSSLEYEQQQSQRLQSRLQGQMNLYSDSENSENEDCKQSKENNLNEIKNQPKLQYQQNNEEDDDNDEEEEYDQVNQLEQPHQQEEEDSSAESYDEDQEQEEVQAPLANASRFQKRQNIQRPQTATGVRKQQVLAQSNVVKKTINNNSNTNMLKSQVRRPQTSYTDKENQLTQSTFRPVYTQSFQSYNMQNKKFNYTQKTFKTVAKRSDPVAKFQSFNNSWKKTKFLQSNSIKGKEGRKLNLSERIQSSKPEEIFYRYLPKYAYF